ncbi:helix-turn-helix domain-containing protein [Streptoalloteichus hindustanus]|uniref:Helix-turn-helix domain-containing protein n=1 Tax=Streptoalloteichus hindustanus TaxID=2017 RepID=A0A1M5LVX3_STRHI|nr:helix-turn-helix transcriptional regulator [Streptoalloteichus hindustanus]SHG69165.1 Helix-turn-helix domain-containing protein [Streptoalloteichus hindustanus]
MAATSPGPAVQRLLLGERLRVLREAAGIAAEDAARKLEWYRAKISKVETGAVRVTDAEVERLLELYRVGSAEARQVRKLAKESRRKNPPARVPDWAKQFVSLESSADEMEIFYGEFIPGPFQTPEYARAMLSMSVVVAPAEIDRMAEARARRSQRLSSSDAPRVWAVFGEEALLRRIGGPKILRGQLCHLRQLAALTNVTIQIMPLASGAHVALGAPFTLLSFERAGATIVYVESLTGADYLTRPQHTKAFRLAFDRLRVAALGEFESLAMIDRHLAELDKE